MISGDEGPDVLFNGAGDDKGQPLRSGHTHGGAESNEHLMEQTTSKFSRSLRTVEGT
jgi:hypothetical protein